ncbi:MAG: peptidase M50, partial [Novipirellula sp. JB048]
MSLIAVPIPAIEPPPFRLRSDLDSSKIEQGQRPARIVIDEVSGRFSRISERGWQQLCSRDADTRLWHQAWGAGWTRTRTDHAARRFSWLAIRIPLGSIDRVARSLAPLSGVLFAPAAIMAWSLVIIAAFGVALSRSAQWMHTADQLPLFLQSTNAMVIAASFVVTKLVHELAHAVMCRRMGARSKSIGIFLFCGLPCPYCDVTDVWRLPSALARGAVMLAGIYVELIIAALATLVWCVAIDPTVRMHAMNLMLVCGISTVLFNANPLMRYDGYYVLSDWLRSTNLRREASDCFRSVVVSRIAGRGYDRPRRYDRRAIALSVYHVASLLYRSVVLVAIASLLIGVAATIHLRFIAVVLVALAATAIILRQGRAGFHMLRGEGSWMKVPYARRLTIVVAIVGLGAAFVFVPIPRYRQVRGVVD